MNGQSHGPGCRCGQADADQPRFTPTERVRALLEFALAGVRHRDDEQVERLIEQLATSNSELVDRQAEGSLLSLLGPMWEHGWLPAEAIRYASRTDARAGRLVATAVAADHARRAPSTLHPRWAAHVEALDLPAVSGATGWLASFADNEDISRRATLCAVILALGALGLAGPLPTIMAPPGSSERSATWDSGERVGDPVLQKVRALLAQAESTTFEAEAAAFTAKAQELMARHAIDAALIWASSDRVERPTAIRLPIDDPYADSKALLLHIVAKHSRCRAVRHLDYGLVSVVGFASDLAATELLFTSLLVQSQAALHAEGAKVGPGGHARSRAFRSSFLLSFGHRIDQRLAAITAAVQRGAAEQEGSLLPVLAARDDAVDGVVNEMFPTLTRDRARGASDPTGWARGRLAADLAQLNVAVSA